MARLKKYYKIDDSLFAAMSRLVDLGFVQDMDPSTGELIQVRTMEHFASLAMKEKGFEMIRAYEEERQRRIEQAAASVGEGEEGEGGGNDRQEDSTTDTSVTDTTVPL